MDKKIKYSVVVMLMMPLLAFSLLHQDPHVFVSVSDELQRNGTEDELNLRAQMSLVHINGLLSGQEFTRPQQEIILNFTRVSDIFRQINIPESHHDIRQIYQDFDRIIGQLILNISQARNRDEAVDSFRTFLLSAQEIERARNFPRDFQLQLGEMLEMLDAGHIGR